MRTYNTNAYWDTDFDRMFDEAVEALEEEGGCRRMTFRIHEITSIRHFDEITPQIDKFADSIGKPLDNEPHWINAHTLVTEVEWGDRKNTHMVWRRVQAQLAEAVKTLG